MIPLLDPNTCDTGTSGRKIYPESGHFLRVNVRGKLVDFYEYRVVIVLIKMRVKRPSGALVFTSRELEGISS